MTHYRSSLTTLTSAVTDSRKAWDGSAGVTEGSALAANSTTSSHWRTTSDMVDWVSCKTATGAVMPTLANAPTASAFRAACQLGQQRECSQAWPVGSTP